MNTPPRLLITCEHATNAVPERYANLFDSPHARKTLQSHRGWDPGAAELSRALSPLTSDLGPRSPCLPSSCPLSPVPCLRTTDLRPRTSAGLCPLPSDLYPLPSPPPCLLGPFTRLLVELNRSPDHPEFWSEFTRDLPPAEKEAIVHDLYSPFRRAARETIDHLSNGGRTTVFHLSVHTFTPVLHGEIREVEIGLLFDPSRPLEVRWADAWEGALVSLAPGWRVRRNSPYRGTDDGHATHLRTRYPTHIYAGIELEVNQALAADPDSWPAARDILRRALALSLQANGERKF